MRKIVSILLISLVAFGSTAAFAQERQDEAVIADALIMRPLGLVAIAFGASVFVVALPFAAITGTTDKAAKALIVDPVNYTFKRGMGDFEYKAESYEPPSKPSGQ